MGRYDEVKVLLKRWEQSFVKEHKRKPIKVTFFVHLHLHFTATVKSVLTIFTPNQEDVDQASEETRSK